MKINKTVVIYCIFLVSALLYGFAEENPYFQISKQDVELKIPKGFPKPKYKFKNNPLTPEVFILGRKLFYDPILSKDSTTSCASCHQRIAAFGHMDHALSHGINGLIGKRNVPALQNLIWQDAFMWDGGVNHLEVQPLSPITNPLEMDESIVHVISKLQQNNIYPEDFKKAFGDTLVSSERILKSLAQFTGLMISADSRYDRFINGTDTFSASEKKGLQLFRDKCAKCHEEPLFTDNTYRNNGLKPDTALKDLGRGAITGIESDNYKFKVPGLRNIERTSPYMHDGRFRNLKEVLNFYSDPNHFNSHAAVEMFEIGPLTEQDKQNLFAFLLTLTDKTFLYDRRFIDPFMK
jgi:cytochrome c peroxidase